MFDRPSTFTGLSLGVLVLFLAASHATADDVIYDVDFEGSDFTLGASVPVGEGTTPVPADRPREVTGGLTATIEDDSTVMGATVSDSQFLRISEAGSMTDETTSHVIFDRSVSPTIGVYVIEMYLLFEELEEYRVFFRNGRGDPDAEEDGTGSAAKQIANIRFFSDGDMNLNSIGGSSGGSYTADTTIHLKTIFDLDSNTWDAYMDDTQLVDGKEIIDEPLGQVLVGFDDGESQSGVIQLDDFRFAIPEPTSLFLLGIGLAGLSMRGRPRH